MMRKQDNYTNKKNSKCICYCFKYLQACRQFYRYYYYHCSYYPYSFKLTLTEFHFRNKKAERKKWLKKMS